MLQEILGFLNYGTLLFFGVFVSAAFLQIPYSRKNVTLLFIFGVITNLIQGVLYLLLDMNAVTWLYPLFVHLPLLLFLTVYFRNQFGASLFAVTSAYLCCQISEWFGVLTLSIWHEHWIQYLVRVIITLGMGYFLIRRAAKPLSTVLSKSRKTIAIFSILPVAYYLFDYSSSVYTSLLYSGSKVVFELLPFILCIAFLLFCGIYFREYEEKRELESRQLLIQIQTDQSMKVIQQMKNSSYEISILRHDMRHHLTSIYQLIHSGEGEKAKSYIEELVQIADETAVSRYCANQMIQAVVSTYERRMKEAETTFDVTIQLPEELPFSELLFTSILSNALENALHAVIELPMDKRFVTLHLIERNQKFLLEISNPYLRPPLLIDGCPVTSKEGHGFGTQSILRSTKKLGGTCQFTVTKELFTLRAVL